MARSTIARGTFGGIAGLCVTAGLLCCALLLAGTRAAASGVLSGEVFFSERDALPPDAVLEVTLLDITRPSRLGDLIASVQLRPKPRPPIPFQITFGEAEIDPGRHYIVHARIVADGRLLFVNARRTRVLTHGHPASVRIMLAAVSSLWADKERQSLAGRTWRAERIAGAPVMDNAPATISLDAEGGVSGSGGCNRLASSAQIDGSTLTFGAIATTRMMCDPAVMDQETRFVLALERTRAFRVEGSSLVLLDRAGAEIVRLAGGP